MRDGLACVYCGQGIEDGAQFTLDHLMPHSKGGSNATTNLVTACKRCNSSRGCRSVRAFCRAVASYLNHGITAQQVEAHVRRTVRRKIDLPAAKALLEKRGSVAAALKK